MIKLIALDGKVQGFWLKQWCTLSPAFENSIFDCSQSQDVATVVRELSCDKKILIVAHKSASGGCKKVIEKVTQLNENVASPACYLMYVGGNGLSDKSDTFWQYYSSTPFGSDELSRHSKKFELLCKKLESAETQENVKSAWHEFDRSAFPEALTAAYLLMVANVPLDSLSVEQWKQACEDYKGIGGENDAFWGNASEWDKNKIGKVREKIGKLFSQVAS